MSQGASAWAARRARAGSSYGAGIPGRAPGPGLVKVIPKHVAACQHSPFPGARWFVQTWRKTDPSVMHRIAYSCGSWRCPGCRRHEGAVTFRRITDALATKEASGWCYFVLTIDREGFFSGKKWLDVNDAYAALGTMSQAFLRRIGAKWGPETRYVTRRKKGVPVGERAVRTVGNAWISVVEAHRSGWPHLNLMVWCPELAEKLQREQEDILEDPEIADAVALLRDARENKEPCPEHYRGLARKAVLLRGDVQTMAKVSGWGVQSTGERARDVEALASYSVKLCGLHDESVGKLSAEIAKLTQLPENAPERFRRLRSGRHFLLPRHKNEEITGCLLRRERSEEGDWEVLRVNPPKDPAQLPAIEAAIRVENALIDAELRQLSRTGVVEGQPPVITTVREQLPRTRLELARAALELLDDYQRSKDFPDGRGPVSSDEAIGLLRGSRSQQPHQTDPPVVQRQQVA